LTYDQPALGVAYFPKARQGTACATRPSIEPDFFSFQKSLPSDKSSTRAQSITCTTDFSEIDRVFPGDIVWALN
jgi:hypothetical protein